MNDERVELTVEAVSAYVSNNPVPASELAGLIANVHHSLATLANGPVVAEEEAKKPAVNPKRSVQHDHLVCLEDGRKFRSLKRHLMAEHGLTPDEYRTKWNLDRSYPITAPGYSAERSELAMRIGLGRKPAAKTPASKRRNPTKKP
jgi:predicted transcriptional regulator